MATDDWRKAAFEEYAERRKIKAAEAEDARTQVERYQTIAKAREAELADLDKAAQVLGIIAQPPVQQDASEPGPSGDHAETRGFKDLALEVLQNAYPKHMRAADVQAYVERRLRKKFHDKTAGMTLFRLSKEGVVRRSGWDWFFVPENERHDDRELPRDDYSERDYDAERSMDP